MADPFDVEQSVRHSDDPAQRAKMLIAMRVDDGWPIEAIASAAEGKYQTARRVIREGQDRGYIEEVGETGTHGRPKTEFSLTETGRESRDFQLSRVASAMPAEKIHDVFNPERFELQYNMPTNEETETIAEAL